MFFSNLFKRKAATEQKESKITALDPLLNETSELIIENGIQATPGLAERMKQDLRDIPDSVKDRTLESMLYMHQEIAEECGDLDVSLSTTDEILNHTNPQYVIFDEQSSEDARFIRFHYQAEWETDHGVEVIILNGSTLLFIGNCGYISRLTGTLSTEDQEFNYLKA